MSGERFAVIGDPIDHSLSPAMQEAAFRSAGIEATYEAIHLRPENLRRGVEALRAAGYRGFNVTVPHKETVAALVDGLAPSAARARAVNTVVRRGGALEGHNTDGHGFVETLRVHGIQVGGERVVVFGAGGSARAIVHALAGLGAGVVLVNRTEARARELAREVGGRASVLRRDAPGLRDAVLSARLVINTTSLGLGELNGESPLPAGVELPPTAVAFDLVYGSVTPFLRRAAAGGCRTLDGLEMLVQQGAESFRLWTGGEPDLDAMRHACRRELVRREQCFAS